MSRQNLILSTYDDVDIVVERQVIEHSGLIRDLLHDFGFSSADTLPPAGDKIPIFGVSSQVMSRVLAWCEQHTIHCSGKETEPQSHIDEKMTQIDNSMLIELIRASNYLEIEALLAHSQQVAANRIKGKSPEDIKLMFAVRDYDLPLNLDFGSSVSSETVTLLPYTSTFHATFTGALHVHRLLQRVLAPELAIPIGCSGYPIWLVKRRVGERTYHADDFSSHSVAGLYLSTDPIPYPPTGLNKKAPKRIVFQTRAADQGWATFGGEGTFHNSHTWFEASILRPLADKAPTSGQFLALEDDNDLSRPFENAGSAREALNERGWDFVPTADGALTWRVCNNITAESQFQNYRNQWKRGIDTEVEDVRALGEGKGFLNLLEPGHIVVMWARAEQGAWVHKVEAATIEIELEL